MGFALFRRCVASVSAAVVVLSVFAGGTGCSSETEGASDSPCPPGQACQARLTILHTSDIHSRIYPYDQLVTQVDSDLGLGTIGDIHNVGGVARMSYVLKRERARSERVVHLDSGDCFQGAPVFNFYAGEPEVRSLSAMGLDAAVIGNHEFDRGALNVTQQFQRWGTFASLVANYKFDDPNNPDSPKLSTVAKPFTVINREGLKIGVIGMGNLSSLTSVFDQPNRLGVTPLNTVETAQGYIDLLRPYVDLVIMVTHLGLETDQRMVRETTGIDIVLGGHNHVVINPPQEIRDCSSDLSSPGFIWAVDPDLKIDPDKPPPNDEKHPDPKYHPYMMKRACRPRNVIIAHSGAFAKYVGRLDVVMSNDRIEASPDGDPEHYEPINKFEIISSKYTAFPINSSVPEDPVLVDMLQPYQRTLDRVADLDLLIGYSPQGSKRNAPNGGDSPLGNLVATAMWLRLGIQTDFSLTNSGGIRTDLNPGPVTVEQMYNIFPFDNSITKMQLSGLEVQDLFDFVSRRSTARGCVSQVQIAGARVRLNCDVCTRPDAGPSCVVDDECTVGTTQKCEKAPGEDIGRCHLTSCAEEVYIGHTNTSCETDRDCPLKDDGTPHPGSCDTRIKQCLSLVRPTNLYELATSNYLAGGGSGFRVLQRNTTQFDTKVQQRDALIDYLRQQKPCGYIGEAAGTPDGLKSCGTDSDCRDVAPDAVCACPGQVEAQTSGGNLACVSNGSCNPSVGRCVLGGCRNSVADFHNRRCASSPDRDNCKIDLDACSLAGEECKILSCVDARAGNFSDDRQEMIGR
ncbi:5'-nucleotidase C-terminal domain-containing protein [Pendulispora rubella]|uniref:5'-nucleotidase C-terminal domain-containing protein n=1 Tax=Pendulispora rubella TaxID=2741070 RepID=A0ABZ2KRS2_9BACT